jgi:hypothetical protein
MIFVVATINTQVSSVTQSDLISDIILITKDQTRANKLANHIKTRRPHPGLDYNLLAPFNEVIVFERELEKIIQNK